MKKVLASSVVVLMILFLSAGLGLARNGGGNGGGGADGGGGSCSGTGISLVCSGVPATIEGTVATESYLGSGLQIDTGSAIVVIYGIGPYWYWENAGVDRPSIGEAVTIDAMEVTFSDGTIRIIAMSITVEGVALQLREACVDGVGGWPLWRGGRNNR
jgi:hypothetical protein